MEGAQSGVLQTAVDLTQQLKGEQAASRRHVAAQHEAMGAIAELRTQLMGAEEVWIEDTI